jgi:hypothetical protein
MQDWAMAANEKLENALRVELSQTMQVNEADLLPFSSRASPSIMTS